MATTTFQGIVRSNGGAGKGNSTPSVVTVSTVIAFDPTAAAATNVKVGTSSSSGNDFILPKGAVPISYMTIGGSTGGTNPTVDIGTSADDDGFFNEVDSDTKGTLKGADGALVVGGGVAADVNVTGKKGASAATGGTHVGVFTYTIADSGAES